MAPSGGNIFVLTSDALVPSAYLFQWHLDGLPHLHSPLVFTFLYPPEHFVASYLLIIAT
jgi:hypothetical protein